MAKSMASAQAKYARKTGAAGADWKQRTLAAEGEWAAELGEFAGGPVGPQTRAAYRAGIENATYRAGDPDKWARNTRQGISR